MTARLQAPTNKGQGAQNVLSLPAPNTIVLDFDSERFSGRIHKAKNCLKTKRCRSKKINNSMIYSNHATISQNRKLIP